MHVVISSNLSHCDNNRQQYLCVSNTFFPPQRRANSTLQI